MNLDRLTDRLSAIGGVEAITLGGSRATGRNRPTSDWDIGIYYRGSLDADEIRALGYEGKVVDPGAWGRFVNGGAWLTIDGERVDLLYRDRDLVLNQVGRAEEGRFEIDRVFGYVAGMASYVLAGELALCKVLHGNLPRPSFPQLLRTSAPPVWRQLRDFSIAVGKSRLDPPDIVMLLGLCSTAVIAEAQARLAAKGEWTLNEKGIAERAGLEGVMDELTQPGMSAGGLRDWLRDLEMVTTREAG